MNICIMKILILKIKSILNNYKYNNIIQKSKILKKIMKNCNKLLLINNKNILDNRK